MGRLAGFKYRQIIKKLKKLGFEFDRQAAGSHEIWFNPAADKYPTIPNHPGDMPEGTLRAILRQADELAGRREPSQDLKIRNYQLRRLCDTLPDSDQQALIVMMDSLVKKSDVARVIGKMAHG